MQKYNGTNLITPMVRFRRVPTIDTCKNIFFCEFPNGDYKESGYKIRKTQPNNSEEYYDILWGPIFQNNIIYRNIFGHDILEIITQKTEITHFTK